jgi:hypothetical protein
MEMKNVKIIGFSKIRLLINLIIFLLLFSFSLYMLFYLDFIFEISLETLLFIVFIFNVMFCANFSYFYMSRLIKGIPALIISEEGFIDQSNLSGANKIYWNELKGFFPYQYKGNLFWGIVLVEPLKHVNNLSIFKRLLVKYNPKLGFPYFSISIKHLSVSEEELFEMLSEYTEVNFYSQENRECIKYL